MDAMNKIPCSGVILSGGLSRRFSGVNKALIPLGGKRIIAHIYDLFSGLFDEIILITNDPLNYLGWDMVIVTDILNARSSLTGIHSGLFHASNPYVFVTACDTPFLKKELVEAIIGEIETPFDVMIPQTSSGFEPLCAVYSKQCINPIEKLIRDEKFKIQMLFKKIRMKTIHESVLRHHDPELQSFFNINTNDDYEQAEKIINIAN